MDVVGHTFEHLDVAQIDDSTLFCQLNGGVRRNPGRPAFIYKPKIEALLGVEVVIFEVQALEPGVLPLELFSLAERLQQPQFRRPVNPADERMAFSP